MRTFQIENTHPSFRKTARLARNGVLVFTEKGKPAFALVGVKDEMALEALALSRNAAFMAYLDDVTLRAKKSRTYSLDEIREELKLQHRERKAKAKKKRKNSTRSARQRRN